MAGRRTRRELKERIAELERRLLDLEQTAGGRLEPEDIFHRVADHSREVFWIKDLSSGRFVYVSPSYDNLYGRRREDLLDDPEDFIRAVHPDDRPGVLAAVRDQDGGGPNFNREFRLQLPDGSIRWIWARTFPLPDEDGRVDRVVGLAEDITFRKSVEAKLGQSESFLSSVIDQSPTPMWISDEGGTLIRLNPACRELLDITDQEVVGKYNVLEDNIVVEQGLLPLVKSVFEDGRTVNFEIVYDSSRLKTIDLEKTAFVVLDTTISPVRNGQGEIVNAVIQHRDITDRELAKKKLEESEANYRSIFEAANDAIFVHDMKTGAILDVNQKMVEMYGYTPEEARQIDVEDMSSGELPFTQEDALRRIHKAAAGSPQLFEWRAKHKNGRLFWVEVNLKRATIGGEERLLAVVRDISERKIAEEALRETEERFRQVAENIREVLYIRDLARGEYVYVSPAFATVFGRPADEIMADARAVLDLIHPDDRSGYEAAVRRQTEEGIWFDLEYRIIRPDGSVRWIRARSFPVPDAQGEVHRLVGIAEDVTDRKRAKEALRESELKFRLVTETIQDVFWMSTCGVGEILYISPAYETLWERSKESLYQSPRSFLEAIHPDDLDGYLEVMDKYHRNARTYECEYRIIRRDGGVRWIRERGFSVPPSSDRARVMIGVCTDITDRRLAEDELKNSEKRYRDLYETVPIALFTVSAVDGSITNCNSAAWKMLGYQRQELLNMKVDDLYADTPDGLVKARDRFERFRLGESIRDVTLEMKHKVGRSIWISLSVDSIADPEGMILESRSVAVDITERRRLEEQLSQSQKMEAVGTLAGGVAHDFNNLMTVVTGFGRMALEGLDPDHPAHSDIQEVINAGERATSLTRQLLAFSRKQILEPKVVDLNQIVTNVEKMLHRLIGEDIEMLIGLDEDLGRVKVDPGQIEQIVMNLAVNAREAMPTGGKLTIETATVHLDESYASQHTDMDVTPGPYAMLAVSDSGPGMDEEVRAKIFEPFFTTKGRAESTGLGLSTVYGIVKQSGGDIHVYSEPGQGTTFKIYFRQVDETAETPESVRPLSAPAEGAGVVLVVEDEDAVRTLISRVLTARGYQVLAAGHGREAIQLSDRRQGEIDLLLTDVVMPLMSGRELAERLAGSRPDMKVLYMSGYTDNVVAHHGVLEAGMAFISKPFSTGELIKKIREVLED